MSEINVQLGDDSYRVRVEPGALQELGEEVRAVAPHVKAALAVDEKIADSHGETARESLSRAGYSLTLIKLAAREDAKTLETVRRMYELMLRARLERESPVIALGGGIIGDTAGFAAATYLRGVPLVQVPTTLLAMVDAAIGGKTGVNTPLPDSDALGKNLIGAFWQPRLVLCDPLVLRTLDPRDFRCGLAECIKHAIIDDPSLLDFIEHHIGAVMKLDMTALTELILRSAAVKVRIVESDARETGQRTLLNLGHTFAHAIESMQSLGLRHGEAVAIGLCAAARAAQRSNGFKQSEADRIIRIVARIGLPTQLPRAVDLESLMAAMKYDKKVRGGAIRLVLPRAIGSCIVRDDIDADAVRDAWQEVTAR